MTAPATALRVEKVAVHFGGLVALSILLIAMLLFRLLHTLTVMSDR